MSKNTSAGPNRARAVPSSGPSFVIYTVWMRSFPYRGAKNDRSLSNTSPLRPIAMTLAPMASAICTAAPPKEPVAGLMMTRSPPRPPRQPAVLQTAPAEPPCTADHSGHIPDRRWRGEPSSRFSSRTKSFPGGLEHIPRTWSRALRCQSGACWRRNDRPRCRTARPPWGHPDSEPPHRRKLGSRAGAWWHRCRPRRCGQGRHSPEPMVSASHNYDGQCRYPARTGGRRRRALG